MLMLMLHCTSTSAKPRLGSTLPRSEREKGILLCDNVVLIKLGISNEAIGGDLCMGRRFATKAAAIQVAPIITSL